MTDILLLCSAFPPGVVVLPGVPLLLVGVDYTPAVEVDLEGSGVLEGVSKSFDALFFGGPRDVFNCKLFELSALDFLPPTLGRRFGAGLSVDSGATNVPGPTDFLGAFPPGFALLNEFGGKWLCLLPRKMDVVDVDMSDFEEFLEVFEAVELLRVIGATPDPLREGTGIAACVEAFFCSPVEDSAVVGGTFTEPPLPGRGK